MDSSSKLPDSLLTGTLPELPSAEQWKKDTKLDFSPRSGDLKAVDAALKTYSEKRAEYNELSAQNRDKAQPYMTSLLTDPGHHEPRQPYLEYRNQLNAVFDSARGAFKTIVDGVNTRAQTKGENDKRDYNNAVTNLKSSLDGDSHRIEAIRDQLDKGHAFVEAAEKMARDNTLQQKAAIHAGDRSAQRQPGHSRQISDSSASILIGLDASVAGRRASQVSNSPSGETARTKLPIIEEYGRSSPGASRGASPTTQPQRRPGSPERSSEKLSAKRSPSQEKKKLGR